MPKIKTVAHSDEYNSARMSSRQIKEAKDCGPVAVSVACDTAYERVRAVMEEEGRKPRRGTPTHIILNSVKRLGFEAKRVNIDEIIRKFPKPHCDVLKNFTSHHPRRFPGCIDSNKRYLMFTSGHVLAISNGIVHDWSVNRSLRAYSLYEIKPAATAQKETN